MFGVMFQIFLFQPRFRYFAAITEIEIDRPVQAPSPPVAAGAEFFANRKLSLAHPTRFERVTFAFGGQRSIQLSYGCVAVHLADWRGLGNGPAGAGWARRKGPKDNGHTFEWCRMRPETRVSSMTAVGQFLPEGFWVAPSAESDRRRADIRAIPRKLMARRGSG
jgi:hypothetical protein